MSTPQPVPDMEVVREQIRKTRKDKGLSQQELAEKAKVSQRTVSAIETGSMDPSVKTLLAILAVLGLGFLLYQQMKGGRLKYEQRTSDPG